MKTNETENTSLIDHIKASPLVQAAITEAVHRFYYDKILSSNPQDRKDLQETQASDVLSTLWNLQPDWRHVIEKQSKRYSSSKVNAVMVFGKPQNIVKLKFEIEL
jgi:hypothetical protein